MLRFATYALPLLLLILALFGAVAETLDLAPSTGAVIRLALFTDGTLPGRVVFGTWLLEAGGLLAFFLLLHGRCGRWWLDGLAAGWTAWIFRGPLLVITVVVAAGEPQGPWWSLAFGWWLLYGFCGLALAFLARRSGLLAGAVPADVQAAAASPPPAAAPAAVLGPHPPASRVDVPGVTADAEPPGDDGGTAQADATAVEPRSESAAGDDGATAGEAGDG
ncbi:MAG: hypothetical protein D6696_12790, partial [Acidobacteria bacterium]